MIVLWYQEEAEKFRNLKKNKKKLALKKAARRKTITLLRTGILLPVDAQRLTKTGCCSVKPNASASLPRRVLVVSPKTKYYHSWRIKAKAEASNIEVSYSEGCKIYGVGGRLENMLR